MATLKSITSANSTFALTLPGLYPAPQKLEGFAVDDMFAFESANSVETRMGADGKLSAGYKPVPRSVTISLMAGSPSNALFDYWQNASETAKHPYECNGMVSVPGLGKSYTLTKGFLKTHPVMPAAKGVMESVQYTIEFESVKPSLLG